MTNDYWSWPKELAAFNTKGSKLCTAVAVLMNEKSIPAEEALDQVRHLAVAAERLYVELRQEWLERKREKLIQVEQYVEAVGWIAGGCSLWSSSCPAYNGHRAL